MSRPSTFSTDAVESRTGTGGALEFEVRLRGPAPALTTLAAALRARGARAVSLRAHYFDTEDDRLARSGIALRIRREGARWRQTLKVSGRSVLSRLEHDVPVSFRGAGPPVLDLERHAGTAAGAALARALAGPGRGGSLVRLVERHDTVVRRLILTLSLGDGCIVEVALDQGWSQARGLRVRIAEVELELLRGPAGPLFDLARTWVQHGGLWLSTVTKAELGVRLAGYAPSGSPAPRIVRALPAQATRGRDPKVAGHPSGAALLRAALQATLEHVLTNASEAADGRQDDAVVHQLRVGLRRLRTALRELGACVPALDSAGPEELARAFEALGRTRDRATITAVLNDAGIAAPGLVGNAQRDEPGRSPQDVVRATSFQVAMLDLLQWAHAEDARFALLQPDAVKRLVAHRLERLHRTVTRHHRRFASMPVDEQHRIRKRLKRLRYLAQFVGGIGWPEAARVGSYLAALEPAQEALGACNDLAMAMTSLDRLAGTSAALPRAFDAVEVGHLLQMRLRGQAKTAARALGAVAKARRFWR